MVTSDYIIQETKANAEMSFTTKFWRSYAITSLMFCHRPSLIQCGRDHTRCKNQKVGMLGAVFEAGHDTDYTTITKF